MVYVPFSSGVRSTGNSKPPPTQPQGWNAVAAVQGDVQFPPVATLKQRKAGNNSMESISLRKMKKDQSGFIVAVKTSGKLGRRIREMGLIPGAEITILGQAPLNDPVALRVMDFTLTLRNNEADYILVHI